MHFCSALCCVMLLLLVCFIIILLLAHMTWVTATWGGSSNMKSGAEISERLSQFLELVSW